MSPTGKVDFSSITIRKVESKQDYQSIVDLHQWIPNLKSVGIVPAYLMEIINERGGLVLGCYDHEKLIGFNFAFPCWSASLGSYLFADAMGFLPQYQRQQLGYSVKRFQYQCASSMNIRYIIWTYDPLLGVNANINIRKLGGIVSLYTPDKYLLDSSFSHATLPADRFEIIWDLHSVDVKKRVHHGEIPNPPPHFFEIPSCNPTHSISATEIEQTRRGSFAPGLLEPVRRISHTHLHLHSPQICLEIPDHFPTLIEHFPVLANEWRTLTRQLFLHYFRLHYRVDHFYRVLMEEQPRNFYILSLATS